MQYIDNPKSGRHVIVSPEMAVMSGAIRTDSIDDLRRFERAFPFDPRSVVAVSQEVLERHDIDRMAPHEARAALSPKEKSDIVFKSLLPRVYMKSAAPGWTSKMYFAIDGAGDYTVTVDGDGVSVAEGKQGEPDATVAMDAKTFAAVMRFEALDDANQLDGVNVVDDEGRSAELSDEQLELVAGGKGSCGGEASGVSAGGATACGGAACGAAACGGAACAADACGGAACGAAANVGAACGGAACGGAACAGAAGGASACGAAACAGLACAAAACGADACAGAACGAAANVGGACAGNACGADFAPGPDLGPCALNVIPIIPFI